MRSWESLRHGLTVRLALGAASCAALAASGSTLAAGGSPLPVPDEPPPGYTLETARKAPAVSAQDATPAPVARAAAGEQIRIPAPDAPVVPHRVAVAKKPMSQGPAARPEPAASPSVESAARVSTDSGRPVATGRAALAGRTVPSAATRRKTTTTPTTAAKPVAIARRRPSRPTTDALPRDAVRLGLPTGTLLPVSGESVDRALLVAGALLAAAAAGGGLGVGRATRRLSRPA